MKQKISRDWINGRMSQLLRRASLQFMRGNEAVIRRYESHTAMSLDINTSGLCKSGGRLRVEAGKCRVYLQGKKLNSSLRNMLGRTTQGIVKLDEESCKLVVERVTNEVEESQSCDM